jgi:DNA-binding MarR family transcriptional regulator
LTFTVERMTVDSTTAPWYDEIVLPVLLGAARKTYGTAIQRALAEVGCDDVPRLGARVLGALARDSGVADIAELCGISKQAASQLVDSLVPRDYLSRTSDEQDRRRVNLRLTARGEAAAVVIAGAVRGVDAAITERVGATALAQAREVVAHLVELGHPAHA